MPKALNIIGLTFNRLTVIRRVQNNKHGHAIVECTCLCGNNCLVVASMVHKGKTKSCGCLHSETISAIQRAKKQANPKSRTKEYRKLMKQKLRQKPEYVIASRLSRLVSWSLATVGAIKTSPTLERLGFTAKELRSHIEKQFLPGMSWANRRDWQIDHITPISSAKTPDEVYKLNCLSNLRPMWATENNKKNNRPTHLL